MRGRTAGPPRRGVLLGGEVCGGGGGPRGEVSGPTAGPQQPPAPPEAHHPSLERADVLPPPSGEVPHHPRRPAGDDPSSLDVTTSEQRKRAVWPPWSGDVRILGS